MFADKRDGQVLKGLLDTLVLGTLLEADDYGFGILNRLEQRLGKEGIELREATLYPLLHRLEAKDFVECYYRPGDRGTQRKYYRITKLGRAHQRDRVEEWRRVAAILRRDVLNN